jgi:hypothetical protein
MTIRVRAPTATLLCAGAALAADAVFGSGRIWPDNKGATLMPSRANPARSFSWRTAGGRRTTPIQWEGDKPILKWMHEWSLQFFNR